MKVVSLFSGVGGLDQGFFQSGYEIRWSNDSDSKIVPTYVMNHQGCVVDTRRIERIASSDIPDSDVIIGGPPCQSWSLGGNMKGIQDVRGKLFYEYIRVIRDKMPLVFVAENVPGLVSSRHIPEFRLIVAEFRKIGYSVEAQLLDSTEFGIPQSRKRVVIIGRRDGEASEIFLNMVKSKNRATLRDAIGNLPPSTPALAKNKTNGWLAIPNHEHFTGGFSGRYMSRNRVRGWDEPAFTIQASGRHAAIHPSAPAMVFVGKDEYAFVDNSHRRLSVRESARIQTFPDSFVFLYSDVNDGYKMVGNAVPVKLGRVIAEAITKTCK